MIKRIPTFLSGMITATLIGGLGVSALAASGAVSFNTVNLKANGETISVKGEDYALDNGQKVPSSITYTDEQGGGTTYLPVRRISEVLGVDVGWDQVTGSVTVTGESGGQVPPSPAPDNTALPTDYSDWSAEEEAAYQEFKGMWEVELGSTMAGPSVNLNCYDTEKVVDTFLTEHTIEFVKKVCYRLDLELYKQYEAPEIMYHFMLRDSWGWADRFSSDEWECGYERFLEYS